MVHTLTHDMIHSKTVTFVIMLIFIFVRIDEETEVNEVKECGKR